MIVQAEVSLYPLDAKRVSEPIEGFIDRLKEAPVTLRTGAMSTVISGETMDTFRALGDSFAWVADRYSVVLVAKVSNACPSDPSDPS